MALGNIILSPPPVRLPAVDLKTGLLTSDHYKWQEAVWNKLQGVGAPVTAFNNRTGNVTLTTLDIVQALGYAPLTVGNAPVQSVFARTGNVLLLTSDITATLGYLPVDPAHAVLTGTPLAPTAADGTSTTQIATTEFVFRERGHATGTGVDEVFFLNEQVVTNSFSIPAAFNASSVGPISLTPGIVATIPVGSEWVVEGGESSASFTTPQTLPAGPSGPSLTGLQTSVNYLTGQVTYLLAVIQGFASNLLATVNTWTRTQSASVTVLTSTGASIAINLALSNNFSHTMTQNTTLAAPSNAVAGTSGQIAFTQAAGSSFTLAFNAQWVATDGSVPTISTTHGTVNLLSYYIVDSTHVWFVLNKGGVV
jgi:hypothetical protein